MSISTSGGVELGAGDMGEDRSVIRGECSGLEKE